MTVTTPAQMQALLAGDSNKAERIAGEYRDSFGHERFFIEIQKQGIPEQDRVNPLLVELAERYGFWLLEDAPYRPLRFRGEEQPSLYQLSPERVFHPIGR